MALNLLSNLVLVLRVCIYYSQDEKSLVEGNVPAARPLALTEETVSSLGKCNPALVGFPFKHVCSQVALAWAFTKTITHTISCFTYAANLEHLRKLKFLIGPTLKHVPGVYPAVPRNIDPVQIRSSGGRCARKLYVLFILPFQVIVAKFIV